ncbi:hypothetical protein [Mesorhizobium sp.]|uniref:hypothetical protein n=1 Tax=Mesorhizobium sp. TaxID=1871066 RepID=UPI000FE68196|nr:hypothetical protein [Mesorhizobium sp.]RWB50844.1 MAG: hypothetical protein EOQ47_31835 [Mesorhizobium sp.]
MKLFLRPLFFLSCLAIAAIALTSSFGVALAQAIAAPNATELVTADVVADVMRIVSAALAIFLLCLVAFAFLISAGGLRQPRPITSSIDPRIRSPTD